MRSNLKRIKSQGARSFLFAFNQVVQFRSEWNTADSVRILLYSLLRRSRRSYLHVTGRLTIERAHSCPVAQVPRRYSSLMSTAPTW